MLMGHEGREFSLSPPSPATDDWDQVVWDLLTITYKGVVNLKTMGVAKAPRGLNLVVGNLSNSVVREFGASSVDGEETVSVPWADLPPSPDADEGEGLEEGEGISILIFDVSGPQ